MQRRTTHNPLLFLAIGFFLVYGITVVVILNNSGNNSSNLDEISIAFENIIDDVKHMKDSECDFSLSFLEKEAELAINSYHNEAMELQVRIGILENQLKDLNEVNSNLHYQIDNTPIQIETEVECGPYIKPDKPIGLIYYFHFPKNWRDLLTRSFFSNARY